MPDWKLTDEQIVNTVNECYKSTGMLMCAAKAVPSDRAIALAAQKRLVGWDRFHLLEAPPFKEVTATFTGSIRWIGEADWQELCKELGVK